MGAMRFNWSPWGVIYKSGENAENIGQIEENIGKYRAG